jgi:hypothetical protein
MNKLVGIRSVVDPNSFYSDSDSQIFFRIRILKLKFWPEFFLMVPLITFICVLESVRSFFLFQVSFLRFSPNFWFYNSVWIRIQIQTFFRIRIQPKYSDYFGYGSTTLAFRVFLTTWPTVCDMSIRLVLTPCPSWGCGTSSVCFFRAMTMWHSWVLLTKMTSPAYVWPSELALPPFGNW